MSHSPFHILLVEDNPADVFLLREAMTRAGLEFNLLVIEDGAEAMEFIQQMEDKPGMPGLDLAILDLNLPKHDGIQLLEALRKSPRLSALPVVITTSSSAPADQSRTAELGISKFLIKPLELEEFFKFGLIFKELLTEKAKPAAP